MSSEILNVKGFEIGNGKPMICVPVMAETKDEIVKLIRKYVADGVDMIEWRIDAFEDLEDVNKLRDVFESVRALLYKTIFVYTYRSKEQGGNGNVSEEQLKRIHLAGAMSGVVDFVDVEYFALSKPEVEIKQIQECGAYVISSHHDFDETPDANVIRMLLEQMDASGADIVKLAVMPQSKKDVFTLLIQTMLFRQQHPNKPIISMSMGAEGIISRVAGEFYGSCVTFGAGDKSSAPGQIPYSKLEIILDILHENYI